MYTKKTQQGFSLIETLFAIAVLMIALVGPMTLAWSSLSSSNDQRNEVTATYLAQESLEYVRNVRDQNFIDRLLPGNSTVPILGGELDDCFSTNGCDINPTKDNQVIDCPNNSSTNDVCRLYIEEAEGYSIYTSIPDGSANPSIFSRKTTITKTADRPEYIVTTTVSWNNRAIPRSLSITSVLYDY